MQGSRNKPPIKHRTALKVSGSTRSIPTLCATKAVPQMVAVKNNINEFRICFSTSITYLLRIEVYHLSRRM